jgi:hypothetical protein
MKFHSFIFVFICGLLFSQNYRDEEVIISSDSPYYGKIVKVIYTYDKNNILLWDDTIFSETYTDETNFTHQKTIYKNDLPYSFELFYSESFTKASKIISRVDYVDKNDNLIGISYNDIFNYEWKSEKSTLNTFKNFELNTINYFSSIFSENTPSKKNEYAIEAKIFRGMSFVDIIPKLEDITKNDKIIIDGYLKTQKKDEMIKYYHKKIKVIENNNFYYIIMQDGNTDIIKYKNALIYYYYIGGTIDGPIFISVGFFENEKK